MLQLHCPYPAFTYTAPAGSEQWQSPPAAVAAAEARPKQKKVTAPDLLCPVAGPSHRHVRGAGVRSCLFSCASQPLVRKESQSLASPALLASSPSELNYRISTCGSGVTSKHVPRGRIPVSRGAISSCGTQPSQIISNVEPVTALCAESSVPLLRPLGAGRGTPRAWATLSQSHLPAFPRAQKANSKCLFSLSAAVEFSPGQAQAGLPTACH